MSTTPRITLNDGTTIPQIGFGTLTELARRASQAGMRSQLARANTETTTQIVGLALNVGYRHIDTAQMYGNERGVGLAVSASSIPRGELYVTSKLGNGNHRPDDLRRSFDETLEKVGLEQLDLFLMHWPLPTLYDGDYVSTWKAMVDLVADGRLRTAGVSNFQPTHLDRIIAETGVAPAVNQIEVHPYFANSAAREASIRHGVMVEAWSPLGRGNAFGDPVISRIAGDRGKTSAQVVLRWQIQHGHIVIPKTMRRERMTENFDVIDFELSGTEMASIDALDKGEAGRIGPNPDTFDWIP